MTIDLFKGEYAFLSNFYNCPIIYEGITYPSSEHAFQAAKTLDKCKREAIATMVFPRDAKQAGRELTLRPMWNTLRLSIMKEIVRAKFKQNSDLATKLIRTGVANLVEGNTWGDYYWGICHGRGYNYLGQILESVRAELTGGLG